MTVKPRLHQNLIFNPCDGFMLGPLSPAKIQKRKTNFKVSRQERIGFRFREAKSGGLVPPLGGWRRMHGAAPEGGVENW
jgi:hypothetical protein